MPRIWEEWGRSADHARPQIVTHANKTTDAHEIGNGLHIDVQPHEFADDDPYCARRITSANVLESLSGTAPVIPWNKDVATKLTYDLGEEKTWISRGGITFFADDYAHSRGLLPVFRIQRNMIFVFGGQAADVEEQGQQTTSQDASTSAT